jgi:hypothetical protein
MANRRLPIYWLTSRHSDGNTSISQENIDGPLLSVGFRPLPQTTPNKFKARAVLRGSCGQCGGAGGEALTRSCAVEIVTDSQYLRDGATIWIKRWKARGWRTASRDPVKNEDLWRRVDAICETHAITWTWVRGHNGHPMNERADALARVGMAPFLGARR